WETVERIGSEHPYCNNFVLDLFLNKREPSSRAQHKCQSHHPQSLLCGCGSCVPKWRNASYPQSHARQRYGFDLRLYSQPFAHRFTGALDSCDSCEVSCEVFQSDPHGNPIEYPDSLNQPEHAVIMIMPAQCAPKKDDDFIRERHDGILQRMAFFLPL